MEKCFNIAGPCFPDEHYMLPALETLPGRLIVHKWPFVNNPQGWMAIFDDDASKYWDEKIYTRDDVVDGKTIHFIGL